MKIYRQVLNTNSYIEVSHRRYEDMTCHICGTKLKVRELGLYLYEDWELYCPHCNPELARPKAKPEPKAVKGASEEELKTQNLNVCLNWIRGFKQDIKWGLKTWEQADAEFSKKMREMGLI